MLPPRTILAATAFGVMTLLSSPVSAFSCPGVSDNGFVPVCCMASDAQFGINCIPAHQMGAQNPTWECNAGPPYRSQGCCQTLGYTNPSTGKSLYACSTYIGP